MKALAAALLALLLCGPPGRGQPREEEEEEEEDPEQEGYDDEDEDEDEDYEAGQPGQGGGEGLLCYACQSLRGPESCRLRRRCGPRHRFCKAFLSHGDTEAGPLTTYSAWCSDTCQPVTRTVERTRMTVTCCQSQLCNVPPWQDPGARDAGRGGVAGPRCCPLAVATTLLLSLLRSVHFLGP